MHSNRTIKQLLLRVLRLESFSFYLLYKLLIFLQWSGAILLAFTEYLLCQGQCVFPLNSNTTTKQRFTKVLRHESLILDLQRIVFAVFYDVVVQFARLLSFFLFWLKVFFPNELKQVNQATIFHAPST